MQETQARSTQETIPTQINDHQEILAHEPPPLAKQPSSNKNATNEPKVGETLEKKRWAILISFCLFGFNSISLLFFNDLVHLIVWFGQHMHPSTHMRKSFMVSVKGTSFSFQTLTCTSILSSPFW